MKKGNSKLISIILGALSLIALLIFLFLPVGVSTMGSGSIMGFNSVFGITQNFSQTVLHFNSPNGFGIALLVLFVVSALFSGLFGGYKRGFYIASFLIEVVMIIFIFTYHSIWMLKSFSHTQFSILNMGAGLIVSGIIMIVHALADLVAFKLAKK